MRAIDWVNLILGILSVLIGIIGLVVGGTAIHKVSIVNKNHTEIKNEIKEIKVSADTTLKNVNQIVEYNNGFVIGGQKSSDGGKIDNISI